MKKTPKMERSSHHRKVNGTNGKETGKMQEGLRLGHATACRKIGNKNRLDIPLQKLIRLQLRTRPNPSSNVCNVRKDMIGSGQDIQARPGLKTNQVAPTTGLGGGQSEGVSGNTGAGNWLQTSK